jgi:hypothetical protein
MNLIADVYLGAINARVAPRFAVNLAPGPVPSGALSAALSSAIYHLVTRVEDAARKLGNAIH